MNKDFLINSSSNNFKLIILTTCWNIEKYAERYIKSLIEQTHTNFVAYIIDDVSTDKTYEILYNLTCSIINIFISSINLFFNNIYLISNKNNINK